MDEKKIVLILNLKLHNFMTNFIDQFSSVDVVKHCMCITCNFTLLYENINVPVSVQSCTHLILYITHYDKVKWFIEGKNITIKYAID